MRTHASFYKNTDYFVWEYTLCGTELVLTRLLYENTFVGEQSCMRTQTQTTLYENTLYDT